MVGHSGPRDPAPHPCPHLNPQILQTQTFLLSQAGENIPVMVPTPSRHTFYSKNSGKDHHVGTPQLQGPQAVP